VVVTYTTTGCLASSGKYFTCVLEVGWSSANTEVRPKNLAECSARQCDYLAELRFKSTNSANC